MDLNSGQPLLLLLGNPNSGKTLLFNRLTGLRQKVANFPGVTVELASGQSAELGLRLVDFPGIYSLKALTRDEDVAVENLQIYLRSQDLRGALCILDGTRLERSLFLALQLKNEFAAQDKPLIFVLNMMDQVWSHKIDIDTAALSQELGGPVVALSAKTRRGFDDLKTNVNALIERGVAVPAPIEGDSNQLKARAKMLAHRFGPRADLMLKSQYRIDRVILSTFWGAIIFAATMLFLFQSIFSWAAPLMDAVEGAIGFVADATEAWVPAGVARDFVKDAVFGGLGSFLVFVPQIFVLTLIIGILEDSGYLARAALICHKPLSYFGLSGKSFVPLLSGHACAIPAIFAARTIESPRKRLLTMLVVPLTSCSARLPVYGLLIASLIPAHTYLGGLVGLQGLSFFVIYAFGILMALVVSGIVNTTLFVKASDAPFVLELPPYRMPEALPILRKSWDRSMSFVKGAGPAIFSICVIIWVLGYFPKNGQLDRSYLSSMGHWIEPVFAPLGIDWKFGVAILMSFLAREVFVGTLGTMLGIEGADQDFSSLADKLAGSGLTVATGVALLVFYAIAMQCAATLAILKKEMGSWKIPGLMFVGYSVLAYVMALFAYWLLSA